jgi:hypothetical protein
MRIFTLSTLNIAVYSLYILSRAMFTKTESTHMSVLVIYKCF